MKTSGRIERMELLDDDEFSLDEIPKKDKKKKKKKAEKPKESVASSIKQLLAGFNERQTKNNVQNTLLKLVADIAGVGLGTALSASLGKIAPAAAIALMGAGHYMGDESGLLRVVGASTLAHSVAKSKEYRKNTEMNIADRLKDVKDGWLYATLLKHYQEEEQTASNKTAEVNLEQIATNETVEGMDWDEDESDFEQKASETDAPPLNNAKKNKSSYSGAWNEPVQDDLESIPKDRTFFSDDANRNQWEDELPDLSLL
ncbi:hypothetical protein [Fluviicola sp.]|uniref:hypothetical protein n=1 Tax=Fluviicola sp. TaxID=1917219 RepID=UPI003D289E02